MGPCSWYQLRSAVLSRAGLSVCGGKIRSLTGMNGLTRDVQSPEADLVSYLYLGVFWCGEGGSLIAVD
jgi:hypothetical protein